MLPDTTTFRITTRSAGVLQSDGCRLSQLRCHTAQPGHIYNKFSWGNRRSLFDEPKAKGVAVREELVKYYRWVLLVRARSRFYKPIY